jgi:methylmalonyl-CoA mutase N-terminal domain/subunit
VERDQRARVAALRASRDGVRSRETLEAVSRAARDGTNLMPPIIAAVEARATVGEIADTLRAVFGEYREDGF